MSDSITITAPVAGGKIPDHTRRLIADAIAKLEGKRVSITIARFIKQRSSNQNRFMHGPFFKAMRAAHAEAGEQLTLDQVKVIFKDAFGVRETLKRVDGTEFEALKSTREYTTIECEEAMEKARAEYAKYNHYLPFPNEGA